MKPAFFSVVITVYNKEQHIAETIKSVLNQSFVDYEIIIVNDGSTDNSLHVIEGFKSKKINLVTTENRGAGAARNLGISKATTNYIALLDGDDIWETYYLEEIEKLIQRFPESLVFATAIQRKKFNQYIKENYSFDQNGAQEHLLLDYFPSSYQMTILTSSSTVIKKEAFDTIGYYDETIVSGQDTDLWIRLGLHFKIAFSKRVCATYKYVADSLFNSTKQLEHKMKLYKFRTEESEHPDLKKFLDLNRFSLAIFCKTQGYAEEAKKLANQIDRSHLNKKQTLLLNLNGTTLRILNSIKLKLSALNIHLSILDSKKASYSRR